MRRITFLHVGQIFGLWTVIEEPRSVSKSGKTRLVVQAKCQCGTVKTVSAGHLTSGASTSCGCTKVASAVATFTTHGKTDTKLYRVWKGIRERCTYEKHIAYPRYGGRGITVCQEWADDFEAFERWALANGWQPRLTIERKNGNGPYCPDNCCIATFSQQARNTRRNRLLTAFGETKCVTEWTEDQRCQVNQKTLSARLDRGWDHERAITTPLYPVNVVSESRRVHLQVDHCRSRTAVAQHLGDGADVGAGF